MNSEHSDTNSGNNFYSTPEIYNHSANNKKYLTLSIDQLITKTDSL